MMLVDEYSTVHNGYWYRPYYSCELLFQYLKLDIIKQVGIHLSKIYCMAELRNFNLNRYLFGMFTLSSLFFPFNSICVIYS